MAPTEKAAAFTVILAGTAKFFVWLYAAAAERRMLVNAGVRAPWFRPCAHVLSGSVAFTRTAATGEIFIVLTLKHEYKAAARWKYLRRK